MKLVPVLDVAWIRDALVGQLGFDRRGVELDRTREYRKLFGRKLQRTVNMGNF
jgi:hypothetical protein